MIEIPTGADGRGPKLYLATVIDHYSRRLLGDAASLHPDTDLACAAIKLAVAARGGRDAIWCEEESEQVIFSTDRGSTYTAYWCYGFYNHDRRDSTVGTVSPTAYENTAAPDREAAERSPPRFGGNHTPQPPLALGC